MESLNRHHHQVGVAEFAKETEAKDKGAYARLKADVVSDAGQWKG